MRAYPLQLKAAFMGVILFCGTFAVTACSVDDGTNETRGGDPPAPPANIIIALTATASSPGSIALSWNPVGNYRFYWVFMDDYLYTQVTQFDQQNPVTAEATGLHAEKEYCFQVVAYTFSPYWYVGESNQACAGTPADTEAPSTPALLKSEFSVATGEMSVAWQAATDNAGVAGYRLYKDGMHLQDVSALSFIDQNLSAATLYCYQVSAFDHSGNDSQRSIKTCASTAYSSSVAQVRETLGASGGVRTSLALDSAGNAHLSFVEASGQWLYHATNSLGEWSITQIDSNVYGSPSLALDESDNVHITYTSNGIYSLKYATNKSGAWIVNTIDSDWVGLFPSMAIDTLGKVHITHYDYHNGNLKYVSNASGDWMSNVIDTGYLVGKSSSIALDHSNKVHVSYYDQGNHSLKYATNAGGMWDISTLDSSGSVGDCSSMVIDAAGKIHVSYHDLANRALKYVTNTAGPWAASYIDFGGATGTGESPALAVNPSGHLHVSYNDWGYDILRYATDASGTWKIYLIEAPSSGGSAIRMDSAGRANISYQHGLSVYYSIYSAD
jgi:hypothetical protein